MRVGYVVLYVNNPDACLDFWVNDFGMELRETTEVLQHSIYKIGLSGQDFSFELVPLKLMENNPDSLDLATPSICFYVSDITSERAKLMQKGITVSEIADHAGRHTFAFSDNEARWFAVMEAE